MRNSTIEYYNKNAEYYISATQRIDFSEVQNRFLDELPNGSLILDFGCGAGRDTKCFLEKGYQVEAMDGSIEMCKAASAYAGIEVRQMQFCELSENDKYDGIWACASVLHLERKELKNVIKKMASALKNDGVVYLSFKYGDFFGEKSGRYFISFTEKTFSELIWELGGFSIVDLWKTEDARTNRLNGTWLNVLLRKRDVYKEYIENNIDQIKLELSRKGVDFWDQSYCKSKEFLELKKQYVFMKGHSKRMDLLLEQSLGQKHLEWLYGPYSIKVRRPLTEEEALERTFYGHLKKELQYDEWTLDDVKRLFWRKEIKNEEEPEKGNKVERGGLCIRLLEWGLDVNAFQDNDEKFRIMKFLLYYEYDNGIRFKNFLENPTMENVDQSHIGKRTRNGEIMNDLKENIAIILEDKYITEVKSVLATVGFQWETIIREIAQIRYDFSAEGVVKELKSIYEAIDIFITIIEGAEPDDKEESLYQQFYLKLSAHEMIGRENDIIDVIEKTMDYIVKGETIHPKEKESWISREDIGEYCKTHRNELAALVYNKEKLSSNEYRDFGRAVKKAIEGLDFFWNETGFLNMQCIHEYLLIISIQEVLFGMIKDKIDNKFYRYQTSDQKSLATELSGKNEPFDKNKIVWIERVRKRISLWNMSSEVYQWEKKIELQIEKILLLILNSNSIQTMVDRNINYVAILNWILVSNEDLEAVKNKIHLNTEFTLHCCNELDFRILLGFLWNSEEVLDAWIAELVRDIRSYKISGYAGDQKIYPLEYYNDGGVSFECAVRIKMDLQNQKIMVMELCSWVEISQA